VSFYVPPVSQRRMYEAVARAPTQHAHKSRLPPSVALRAAVVLVTCVTYLVPAAFAGGVICAVRGREAAGRLLARRFVALIERLGPTFVKCGQVVSTRRDLLPAVLCEELDALADSVTPMSAREAREVLVAAYGAALEPFKAVDDKPIASGSVACVVRGTLPDERQVAIKLQRPAIRGVMADDLALVRAIGELAQRLPWFRGAPVGEIVGYVCDAIYAQLDFAREAKSLSRLYDNLAKVPRVWVPAIETRAGRDRAIVMQFIPHLDASAAATASLAMRKRYAATTLAAVYRMLFIDGFVHCDLHRGNLYFTRSGQVVVLDAGFIVQLSDRIRRLFAEFFLNLSLGNGERCARIVVESSTGMRPDADLEGFTREMTDLVTRNSGAAAKSFSLLAFARELFALQRRFGLHAASEIVFPLLSLFVIEGTIRELDPAIDFQREAQSVLSKALFEASAAQPAAPLIRFSEPATTQEVVMALA
jgi:ubiquinone biosynthesis protein